MVVAAILAVLLTSIPAPVQSERDVFDEIVTRILDDTQNPIESIMVGLETEWSCEMYPAYFELVWVGNRYFGSPRAERAMQAAGVIGDVALDICEDAPAPPFTDLFD